VTTQSNTVWTPDKRIQFRIGIIRLWMADVNEKDSWGQKLYRVFNTYLGSLQRQLTPSRPGKAEYREMQIAIESIHAIIDELEDENMMDLYGWSFGQRPVNRAQGMLATLLAIRGELLTELTELITN
jgi:hypothetical protein